MTVSLSVDHFVGSSPQTPASADFFSGKLESPVALRDGEKSDSLVDRADHALLATRRVR